MTEFPHPTGVSLVANVDLAEPANHVPSNRAGPLALRSISDRGSLPEAPLLGKVGRERHKGETVDVDQA